MSGKQLCWLGGGLFLVGLTAGPGSAQEVSFAPAVLYPAGEDPSGLAAFYFDGDGDLDPAVSGYDTSVLFNDGTGAFGGPVWVDSTCGSVAGGEIDGDREKPSVRVGEDSSFAVASHSQREEADYPKLSPFTGVRWQAETPEVEYAGTWYELNEVNDVPAAEIVAFCKKQYGRKWQQRFGEDFVQALTEMGHTPERTVKLKMRGLADGKVRTIPHAFMTHENRRRIRTGRTKNTSLTADQIRKDIHQLATLIENNYSYLGLKKYDYRARLDALHARVTDGFPINEFGVELRKIVAGFGDGHSRVKGWFGLVPRGYTPFVLEEVDVGVVALKPDRSGLLDPKRPFVQSIDAVSIDRWIDIAGVLVAQGSPQFVRQGAMQVAHCAQFVRRELGRELSSKLSITISAGSEGTKRRQSLSVIPSPPHFYPDRPEYEHRLIEGNIGYIRIGTMAHDSAFINSLKAAMAEFQTTDGVVLDLRGNSGGSRDALMALFPYFMRPDDHPNVANAAKYRIHDGDDPHRNAGFMSDRFLYPEAWSGWSDRERNTIREFARGFTPQWSLPEGKFSDWHYMVLSPSQNAGAYHYANPLVLLIDRACYSATDIFSAAFKGWPNVTVMGTATGGGSGRSEVYRLDHSGLQVQLSTMASFQPTGQLYDGNGVHPDVVADRTLDDLLG